MNRIAVYLFIALSWLLARMPHFILYGLADFVFIVLYYIVGYRKKVVFNNLRNSFPEKYEQEIQIIAKRFFRHLGDLVIENAAIPRMSEKRLRKIIRFKNPDFFDKFYKENKNLVAILGHYANWELCSTIPMITEYQILSVYKPLNNKFFDKEFYNSRKKFGALPVSMDNTFRAILDHKRKNKLFALGLIADQRPLKSITNHWVTFLNQDTPVFFGPEKIAKKFNLPVIYSQVDKIKRGYFEIEFTLLIEDPSQCKENEITEMHLRFLEKKIIEKPEYWLWSHKRWKHKREPETISN